MDAVTSSTSARPGGYGSLRMISAGTAIDAPPSETTELVRTSFEPAFHQTMWASLRSHNFSPALLGEIHSLLDRVSRNGMAWPVSNDTIAVRYIVLQSDHPRLFSLGGDLHHFHSCIQRGDEQALREYSMSCLRMIYEWATVLNDSVTTIALVQGRTLGGGFEAALSADFLIAEEQAEFGFPEIAFGLFPCSGAMSLLARRISTTRAADIMTNGRIYSAGALREMGIVDEVCPQGAGDAAVRAFIERHAQQREARMAVQRARQRAAPLDYSQLVAVVDEWVALAMRLRPRNLHAMDLLARLQAGGMLAG